MAPALSLGFRVDAGRPCVALAGRCDIGGLGHDQPGTGSLAVVRSHEVIGDWKAVLLFALLDGPQRTCDLEKRIAGLSQKVLIEQLRALEEHGVVRRQPVASDAQGIEYLLTPLGESLKPILQALMAWGVHHANEVDETHRLLPCEVVVRDRVA